ncbi:MAG: AN1-type zinc finger domain-containing protein [Candidatus Norongarragalinales archaeon]
MPKCEQCGKEVDLPFQCNFCGHYFCIEHRIPESHNCPNQPARTPIGSYQTKQMLAYTAKKKELETISVKSWKTETKTYDNIFGHHFNVPIEVYSDEKYREKLNKARTLNEVERIIRDYYKHHPKKNSET